MNNDKIKTWEEVLLQTRSQLLQQELGVSDFDPGRCFTQNQNDDELFTFRNCCNGIPEYEEEGMCFRD